MVTASDRQRAFKARMAEQGFVQCNVWVPASAVAEIQRAAELMRERPLLTVGRLVDTSNGRMVGLRKGSSRPA